MIELPGDIWGFYDLGCWAAITTNGFVKTDGEAVMGRGVALQAKRRFPQLPADLGRHLKVHGNIPVLFEDLRIMTFPVKRHWRDKADLELIRQSAELVRDLWLGEFTHVPAMSLAMVRPGCGNGRLGWADVKPVIEPVLENDCFVIVERDRK